MLQRVILLCALFCVIGFLFGRYQKPDAPEEIKIKIEELDEKIRDADRILKKFKGLERIPSGYELHLKRSSNYPYAITPEMLLFSAQIPSGYEGIEYVFDWSQSRLEYARHGSVSNTLMNSKEVWDRRVGNCIEQAVLCASLLILSGHDVGLAKVDVDYKGKKVHHACVIIYRNNRSEYLLLDSAYHKLGVQHQKFSKYSNMEIVQLYRTARYKETPRPSDLPSIKSIFDYLFG